MGYRDNYTTEYLTEQKFLLLPELEKALKIAIEDLAKYGDIPVDIKGVSNSTAKKLFSCGIKTVAGLVLYTAEEIMSIKGIGVRSTKEIIYLLTYGIKENFENINSIVLSWAKIKEFADGVVSLQLDKTPNLSAIDEDQIYYMVKELVVAYDEFLSQIAKNSTSDKYIRTYKKYYLKEFPIVSNIATEEKVSRQTIYSRLKHADKIIYRLFGKGLNQNAKIVSNFFLSIANAIKGVDYKKFFIAVSSNRVALSPLARECIKYAFGEKVLLAINNEKERISTIISKIREEEKNEKSVKILDKIVYQDNIYGTMDVYSTGDIETDLQKRLFSKLSNTNKVLSVIKKPSVFRFSKNGYTRTPDFYIILESGREVLVAVMSEWFMTTPLNREYFKGIKEFCLQNHIGYLITDGRGNTFDEFLVREVPIEAKEKISNHLSKYGKINYKELKAIKDEFSIKTEDVIAYCIQNDCYAQYSPWLIKKIPKV